MKKVLVGSAILALVVGLVLGIAAEMASGDPFRATGFWYFPGGGVILFFTKWLMLSAFFGVIFAVIGSVGFLINREPSGPSNDSRSASITMKTPDGAMGQTDDPLLAGVLLRAGAKIIDYFVAFGPMTIFVGPRGPGAGSSILGVVGFYYFLCADGFKVGQSGGKWIMRIRVIRKTTGQSISPNRSLLRNVLFFLFLGLLDVVFTQRKGTNQRIGDIAADTIVVIAACRCGKRLTPGRFVCLHCGFIPWTAWLTIFSFASVFVFAGLDRGIFGTVIPGLLMIWPLRDLWVWKKLRTGSGVAELQPPER